MTVYNPSQTQDYLLEQCTVNKMKREIAKKIVEYALDSFSSWNQLLKQACITHTPRNKNIDELDATDFYRLADDGWFDVYEEDAYAFLKNLYGKSFKSETYLKKGGGFKERRLRDGSIKTYSWIQYCRHIAIALNMKYQGKI